MSDESTATAPETPEATEPDPDERGPKRVASATEWADRAFHADVTLPSGAVVDIRLPNLQKMIQGGTIPNHLLESAISHQKANKVTAEMIKENWEYTCFIIPRTVVNPEITEADVPNLPTEDIELLAQFAARSEDMDAAGKHLGGLETQRSFRDARGLTTLAEALGDM